MENNSGCIGTADKLPKMVELLGRINSELEQTGQNINNFKARLCSLRGQVPEESNKLSEKNPSPNSMQEEINIIGSRLSYFNKETAGLLEELRQLVG
jgi:chromosome segregation ATPase